jgi:hypothetical protein
MTRILNNRPRNISEKETDLRVRRCLVPFTSLLPHRGHPMDISSLELLKKSKNTRRLVFQPFDLVF